jgi:hypothetical protein
VVEAGWSKPYGRKMRTRSAKEQISDGQRNRLSGKRRLHTLAAWCLRFPGECRVTGVEMVDMEMPMAVSLCDHSPEGSGLTWGGNCPKRTGRDVNPLTQPFPDQGLLDSLQDDKAR